MKKRPVIGVPSTGHTYAQLRAMYSYLHALRRAGAKGRVLLRTTDPRKLDRYLAACDGFLMTGGGDVDPSRYGQEKEPGCGESNALRDSFELALLERVYRSKLPLLGICRGCQIMAVAAGGTLVQDIIPIQKIQHRDRSNLHTGAHWVTVEPDSLLQTLLPAAEHQLFVNTCHHQVVDRPGQGMRVVATSPDGFVEAIQRDDRPFCLGVQWHPERMVEHLPVEQLLFDRFVAACRR